MRIFDPHLQTDTRSRDDLQNLSYFGTHEVVSTAHARRSFATADDLINYLKKLAKDECDRVEQCGLIAHVALGVAPDAQPVRAHYEVWRELPELLGLESVVALGEIGAWQDTSEDWELFERQVKMAVDVALPLVIAPPDDLHVNMVYKMMRRLDALGCEPERVLFTRMDERAVETILAEGYVAAVSAGTGALGPRGAARLVKAIVERSGSAERLMLSSSIEAGAADVLAVPKAVAELSESWSEAQVLRVVNGNARTFYGV